MQNRVYKKRRARKREVKERRGEEKENPKWPECVRARAAVGTWHARVPVSLDLARTH